MYILTRNVENDLEDAILEGESIYLERIQCSFEEGIPLPSKDIQTPILFKLNEFTLRGKMTDHLSVDEIQGPVVSLRVKTLLDKAAIKNIEYYNLAIRDEFPNGKKTDNDKNKFIEYTDYFIANVVGLVDCVDHEKSILEYFYPPELRNPQEGYVGNGKENNNDPFADENPNDIDFITKLVLDESKIDPKLKIFRLKDQPDLLVFHESIVAAIRQEGLSGFVFVPVDEYTDAIPDEDEDEEKKENANEEILPEKELVKPKETQTPKEVVQTEDQKPPKKSRFGFFVE